MEAKLLRESNIKKATMISMISMIAMPIGLVLPLFFTALDYETAIMGLIRFDSLFLITSVIGKTMMHAAKNIHKHANVSEKEDSKFHILLAFGMFLIAFGALGILAVGHCVASIDIMY